MYYVLFRDVKLEHATVPIRDNLDIVTGDSSLAVAELDLAHLDEHGRAHTTCPNTRVKSVVMTGHF